MQNFLHKLQKLPETQRKILAVLTMVVVTPLFFYMFAGIFKDNLTKATIPANNVVQAQENQLEPGISPIDWVAQSASILKSNGIDFIKTLLEAIGSFADGVSDAEQKLLPGFNSFLAGIINSINFWK